MLPLSAVVALSSSSLQEDQSVALSSICYKSVCVNAMLGSSDILTGLGHEATLVDATGKSTSLFANDENGKSIGLLTLNMRADAVLGNTSVSLQRLAACPPSSTSPSLSCMNPEPAMNATIRALNDPVVQSLRKVIGQTLLPIVGGRPDCRYVEWNGSRTHARQHFSSLLAEPLRLPLLLHLSSHRVGECTMGDLVTNAMLEFTEARLSQQCDVVVINGGSLRNSIPVGNITQLAISSVLPFDDTLSTFKISGSVLVAIFQRSLSLIGAASGSGGFLQVAGVRVGYNPKLSQGLRLISLKIGRPDRGYLDVVSNRLYSVCSTSWIRSGQDGYTIIPDSAIDPVDFGAPISEGKPVIGGRRKDQNE